MKSRHRYTRNALLSVLGLAIPLGLGIYHRKVNGGESYHQFYTFPKTGARPVVVKYGDDGILHQLISPHSLGGTIGLTNQGDPVWVRMRMVGVPDGLTIHWENGYTRDFNLETKTVERTLSRGESVSVHHTFYVGERLRRRQVIFNGGLEITDELTGKRLLTIPIRILNTGNVQSAETEVTYHER